LLDFFDQDMFQIFEFERFLFDHVIPRDLEALEDRPGGKGCPGSPAWLGRRR
jgi:hypothetical protein